MLRKVTFALCFKQASSKPFFVGKWSLSPSFGCFFPCFATRSCWPLKNSLWFAKQGQGKSTRPSGREGRGGEGRAGALLLQQPSPPGREAENPPFGCFFPARLNAVEKANQRGFQREASKGREAENPKGGSA
jgi:hypothetical protein